MFFSSVLCTVALALAGIVGAAQYCDPATSVCYSETKAGDLYVRVALPAVDDGPFDVLVQIVAPKAAVGWGAIAWGAKMTSNPLTVAWANGNTTVVSSRWADAHTPPVAYPGATYTVLKGSVANSTHWTLTALCSRCTSWTADNEEKVLYPGDRAAKLAYAVSPTPPPQPANNASSISRHSVFGYFTVDFASAKTDKFQDYVKALS